MKMYRATLAAAGFVAFGGLAVMHVAEAEPAPAPVVPVTAPAPTVPAPVAAPTTVPVQTGQSFAQTQAHSAPTPAPVSHTVTPAPYVAPHAASPAPVAVTPAPAPTTSPAPAHGTYCGASIHNPNPASCQTQLGSAG